MKLSIDWIRDYVAIPEDLPLRKIVHDLTMATVEVENAVDPGVALERIVVGRVLDLAELPGRNESLVIFDVGEAAPVTIVSSGRGFRPGLDTIVALPGSRIQSGSSRMVVEPREVAGKQSAGAVCRASDVGLDGVLLSPDPDIAVDLSTFEATPGMALADAIGWHDIVLDIDNKSLTHRPDLWCHWGIARELAAIYDLPMQDPELAAAEYPATRLIGEVDPELCARFAALRIEDIELVPSPFWLRRRLARLGQRPVNVIVDLTNYVMLDVGQPTHAYDAAKLTLPLGVRRARDGETLALLDGSGHKLSAQNTLITDADQPAAAAGVMGGAASMVTGETTSVVLEAANFNPLATRRSAAAFGLRTEASARYEKGLDVQRVEFGLARFAAILSSCVPGARITAKDVREHATTEPVRITTTFDFLFSRLGKTIEIDEIVRRLSALGFAVDATNELLHVVAPTWRSTGDVSMACDLVEEVARLHGYQNFAPTWPTIELKGPTTSRVRDVERHILEALASFGLHEVIFYPWVKDRYLEAAGYEAKGCVRLADPPSPDQASLQRSLIPGLLEAIEANLRYLTAFNVFTCDDVYGIERSPLFQAGELLPVPQREIAAAFVGRDLQTLMREARGVLEALSRVAHLAPLTMEQTDDVLWAAPGVQFALRSEVGNAGVLAVLSERARRRAGLKRAEVVAFTLYVDALKPYKTRENYYSPPPVHQQTQKDLSLVFPFAVTWLDIVATLDEVDPLVRKISFVDLYKGKGVPEGHQSITLRVTLGAEDRTLEGAEIEAVTTRIVDRLGKELRGTLRS